MIRFSCACGKVIQANEMFAGKRVKCPACGQPVAVPAAVAPPSPAPSPVDDLLGPESSKRAPAPETPLPEPDAATPHPRGRRFSDSPARAASGSGRMHLHLPFSSMCGLCLLIAFFLPWMKLSCGNMVIAEPTGLNLALNTEDSAMKSLAKDSKSETKLNPMGSSAVKVTPTENADKDEKKEDAPWGNKTPELLLFPVLGLALAGWGIFRLKNPSENLRGETTKFMIIVFVAVGMLFIERHRDYRKKAVADMRQGMEDAKLKMDSQPKASGAMAQSPDFAAMEKEMREGIKIESGIGFWMSVLALVGAAVGMGAWMFSPGAREG